MPVELTFNFTDTKGTQSGKIKAENASIIKNIFPDFNGKELTRAQYENLVDIAASRGAKDVLEAVDLQGRENLKYDIANGNADYDSMDWYNPLDWLTFCRQSHQRQRRGDEIQITGIKPGTTLSSLRSKYHLPEGALKHEKEGNGGGDFDRYTVDDGEITFSVKDFAAGNHMTVEEVRKLFGK